MTMEMRKLKRVPVKKNNQRKKRITMVMGKKKKPLK